jgi:nitrate/TMAO reductase-like tetraheme cytochrome c subunit
MTTRLHAVLRVAWIALATLAAIVALGVAIDRVSASPELCAACHEMKPAVAAWKTSSHTRVACAACHETPRPWYQLPVTLWHRGAMLGRDLGAHISGSAESTAAATKTHITIPDDTCLACHDPDREVTMRYGTLIDHTEHAARNKSCVSCHLWTAHPGPDAERPLLLMRQCFACHGRTAGSKAPGTCDVCHPTSFDKRPATHGLSTWATTHGKPAKADRPQCLMCHEEAACRTCHGVEMPHPSGWTDGATGHSRVADEGRQTCAKCHAGGLAFCSMCHHEGYDARTGPWVAQHPSAVEKRGAASCIECHGPLYCVKCHTRTES